MPPRRAALHARRRPWARPVRPVAPTPPLARRGPYRVPPRCTRPNRHRPWRIRETPSGHSGCTRRPDTGHSSCRPRSARWRRAGPLHVIHAGSDVNHGSSGLMAQDDRRLDAGQWMPVSNRNHQRAPVVLVKVASTDSGEGDLHLDLTRTGFWLRHLLDANVPRTSVDGSAHDVPSQQLRGSARSHLPVSGNVRAVVEEQDPAEYQDQRLSDEDGDVHGHDPHGESRELTLRPGVNWSTRNSFSFG